MWTFDRLEPTQYLKSLCCDAYILKFKDELKLESMLICFSCLHCIDLVDDEEIFCLNQ